MVAALPGLDKHTPSGKEDHIMNRHTFRSVPARKRGPIAVLAAAVAAAVSLAVAGYAGSAASAGPGRPGAGDGLCHWAGTAQRPAAAGSPDRGERPPGRPEQ